MISTSAQSPEYYRIFVGGLSYEVDNNKLKDTFTSFGNLKKALVIRDQRTGQSKGYGFVAFSDLASFQSAMDTDIFINGRKADCHQVLTKGALKELEQRDFSNKIFVGGISQSTQNSDLQKYFSKFGAIKESRILYDGKSGKSRGFAFVLFQNTGALNKVLEINEHKLKGKVIEVKRFSKDRAKEFEDLETTHDSQGKPLSPSFSQGEIESPATPTPLNKKKSKRRKGGKDAKIKSQLTCTSAEEKTGQPPPKSTVNVVVHESKYRFNIEPPKTINGVTSASRTYLQLGIREVSNYNAETLCGLDQTTVSAPAIKDHSSSSEWSSIKVGSWHPIAARLIDL